MDEAPQLSVYLREEEEVATSMVFVVEDKDGTVVYAFEIPRKQKVDGLLDRRVFTYVHISKIPPGARIFNSRFVDTTKNKGAPDEFEKSRLVIQAYGDSEKELVLTQSEDTALYLRDITQAYVQTRTNPNRDIYARPPKDYALQIPKDHVLKINKPLYGVPEAGNHWFSTYHKHYTNELHVKPSTFDPCLLYCNDKDHGFGVVGMQTDDTLIFANNTFADLEDSRLKEAKLATKPREQLTDNHSIKFNGGLVTLRDGDITLTQERQCENIGTINSKEAKSLKDQYVAQRARGAYVASVCQPEASFDLSFAAQTVDPQDSDIKALNNRLRWQIENKTRGLKYVKLDENTLRLVIFSDASFANNKDLTSQIGYVIVLADGNNKANILHWSSVKCKRVTRSVLASELYAMVHAFDISSSLRPRWIRFSLEQYPLYSVQIPNRCTTALSSLVRRRRSV